MVKKYYADAGVSGNGTGILQQSVIAGFSNKLMFEVFEGGFTNNESEMMAIIYTACCTPKNSVICSDSQLAVNLCNNKWKTKMPNLKLLKNIAKNIINLKKIKVIWEPREQNLAGIHIETKYGL